MSNKLYGDNVKDYLVEGAGKKGYRKISGGGYGDGKTSSPVKDYGQPLESGAGWVEGKK